MARSKTMTYEIDGDNFLGDMLSGVLGSVVPGILSESQEAELANELLEVSSEEELEEFLGDLFNSAVRGISNFAKSDVGQAVIDGAKTLVKKGLPAVGGALGSFVAPGIGTTIGTRLGTMASGLINELPVEVEPQELDHEVAKRIVQIGAEAARQASRLAPSGEPPTSVASKAIVNAVSKIAPAALVQTRVRPRRRQFGEFMIDGSVSASRREGRWQRRGQNIVLLDV
ncbi:hypothetical protein [Micromonospora cathayae]|uniref:Uncharacterized protein n=1 Tax=Micromonospora cathayae TaxID=3028804 RepID=A0ABY7ZIW6_9ACTN|nr:hypothetical protein [Micromonospora sp. HUAS 3]WDZ82900.1 hypothetical protein PVK37_20770 [Micromonospora sp. HUAS 3]